MSKEIKAKQYIDAVKKIQEEALQASVALLKEKGENCYIAFDDFDDFASGIFIDHYGNTSSLSIFGVGLDNEDNLCVGAVVDNIGYGHSEWDFPQKWTNANQLLKGSYPYIYRFIASNIDKSVTKSEADEIAKKYWSDDL